jgi:hypothetical protein
MTVVGSGARDFLSVTSAGDQLSAGARRRDNDLVFATTIGTPLDSQNIDNRHFKPLLRRAESWYDRGRTKVGRR